MSKSPHSRRIAVLTIAALSLAGNASAQFKSAKLEKQRRETDALLDERNRETMHPGGALDIVGLEQGDNEIRSRTPALERSDRAAAQVDADELRERRLAMYESGARFHSAPTVVRDAPGEQGFERGAPAGTPKAPAQAPDPASFSWSFVALLVVVAALGWQWMRQRFTPKTAAVRRGGPSSATASRPAKPHAA